MVGIQSWLSAPSWILSRRLQMRQPILKVSDLQPSQKTTNSTDGSGLSIVRILFYSGAHRKLARSGLVSFFIFQEPLVKSEPASPGLWSVTKLWKPGWKPYQGERLRVWDILSPLLFPSQSDDWKLTQIEDNRELAISFNYKMRICARGRHDQHLMKIRKQQKSFATKHQSLSKVLPIIGILYISKFHSI